MCSQTDRQSLHFILKSHTSHCPSSLQILHWKLHPEFLENVFCVILMCYSLEAESKSPLCTSPLLSFTHPRWQMAKCRYCWPASALSWPLNLTSKACSSPLMGTWESIPSRFCNLCLQSPSPAFIRPLHLFLTFALSSSVVRTWLVTNVPGVPGGQDDG